MSEESDDNVANPDADMEPHPGDASLGSKETPGSPPRVRVSCFHYRRRLCDPDGLSIKAVLDGLVKRGILRDDSWREIEEIRHRQIKTSGQEETVIVLEEIGDASDDR